jgi:hypothetical protein
MLRNNMKKQLLVFDFDGVLADTYQLHVDFLRYKFKQKAERAQALLSKSCQPSKKKKWIPFKVSGQKYFYHYLIKHITDQHRLLFHTQLQQVLTMPQSKAIVSLGSKKYIEYILGSDTKHFAHIIGRFEMGSDKAKGLALLSKESGFALEDMICITDTVADIHEFAKCVSFEHIWAVDWGFCPAEALLPYLEKNRLLRGDFSTFDPEA